MSARSSRISSRTTAFLVVAVAHGLVLWMFWRVDGAPIDEAEGFTSVLFFLPATSDRGVTPLPALPERAMRATAGHLGGQSTAPEPPAPHLSVTEPSNAITLPVDPGAAVDWSAQLRGAADAALEKEQRARQQLGALTQKFVLQPDSRNPGPVPPDDFRWYDAGAHRIDTRSIIPVLHLNDRCLLIAFVMPVCLIGHIEIHGDLFEKMDSTQGDKAAAARPNDAP